MKLLLPKFLLLFAVIAFFFIGVIPAHADTGSGQQVDSSNTNPDGHWVQDQEVTFVGKTASRANDFLDWTLQNYDWACVKQVQNPGGNNAGEHCDNSNNPIETFWVSIRNIVFVFLILFVLAAAFVIIITRGQNLTIMKFIPRFIIIVVLIAFSYSIIQFSYQVTDVVQGCFLRLVCTDTSGNAHIIGTSDLLSIGFDYNHFIGYYLVGAGNEESRFISLLLVRLTAFTYYVMTGVLLVRKIILWFFLIISPVFPLLLFYSPLRNSAKVWLGEFFRWLLYAPIFAIFLHGLVVMWKAGVPLAFTQLSSAAGGCTAVAKDSCYPTVINILLGGPGQLPTITNSVNLRDTFSLYVIALLMLWVVILLPFLLLNIFLDYLKSFSFSDSAVVRSLALTGRSFLGRPPSPAAPTQPPPQGAGLARSLPFMNSAGSTVRTIPVSTTQSTTNLTNVAAATEVMKLTNLSIPKMRDIAQYETSMISKNSSKTQEVSHASSTLQKIANPQATATPAERERFTTMREKLVQQKQKGDPVATSILSASSIVGQKHSVAGSPASPMSQIGTKVQQFNTTQTHLPVVNKVQQVSLEDYEEVRKLWEQNYSTLEPPKSIEGQNMTRKQWVKSDMDKVNQAVNLLTSVDPVKNKEGMDMVANILPFLLIGGFSRSEVIAYLKAKLEAAKSVLNQVSKKEDEEETMVGRNEQHAEADKKMTMEEEAPEDKEKHASKELPDNPIFQNVNDEEKKEPKV